MTDPSTPPSSKSYELRPSTAKQTEASCSSPKGRKVISILKTASSIQSPTQSSEIDPDKTRLKIAERVYFTYEKFRIAGSLGCNTSRGSTRLNGSHAKIEDYEAAHASLTPTLYDDYSEKVKAAVNQVGLDNLSPSKKTYIHRRFDIDNTPQRKKRQGNMSDVEFFDHLTHGLSKREQRGSFVGTSTELLRNSTVEQPRSSNRLDCYLESELRGVEDELAQSCTNQTITPQQAMEQFIQKYLTVIEIAINNLKERQKQFESFLDLHKKIIDLIAKLSALTPETTSSELYKEFIQHLQHYLNLKTDLKKRLSGTPSLSDFISFSQTNSIYFPLTQIVKNYDMEKDISAAILYFHATKDQLKSSPFPEEDVEHHRTDFANRLKEAETQSKKLKAVQEEPASFDKLYFGIVDPSSGVRRTPSKEEIQQQLLEKVEPTRKKKPRKLFSPEES